MGMVEKAKVLAEIADITSRIYGLLVDKSRSMKERDDKIKELERQVAELKTKAEAK